MTKQDLRIVFMGTPDFAKVHLEVLVENKYNVVGVFCREDKPKGRGMKMAPPPVKEYADMKNIPVYQPNKVKNNPEVMEKLKQWNPNLIIVVAYGRILPKEILDFPEYGAINVHGSILPKYRGAAPIQWSVINGDRETGVTTMYMDEGMDTGDMITISKVPIESNDTYESVHDKLAIVGAKTLLLDLERLVENNGKLDRTKQPEDFTIAPMLSKDNSRIDFNDTADSICNLIRGTNPFPGAWCKLDEDRTYKVYQAERIDYEVEYEAELGEIVELNDKKGLFVVRCKDGYVNFLKLKAPGTRLMTAAEYIRGGKVKVGERFN
ncbi:MAG: methionyl-tRNA formyltransferase [Clostridia bacterium]|nr:methionyl-tRNA formyltransferase [Clostridia bacterium]